jgi:hypothetical protein
MTANRDERYYTLTIGPDARPTLPRPVMQYSSLERLQDMNATCSLLIDGYPCTLSIPVPYDVAPVQVVSLGSPVTGFVPGVRSDGVLVPWTVTNWLNRGITGTLSASLPAGWTSKPQPFTIAAKRGKAEGTMTIVPPSDIKDGAYPIALKTSTTRASGTIEVVRAKVRPGIRLGLIESYDNTLAAAAAELGVTATKVSDIDIREGKLKGFDVVLVDIRAYLVRDALKTSNQQLLSFAHEGGTLIVMYQRDQEWKPDYAPYPFAVTRRRVTDEDAPVSVLEPVHPLFTTPNRIQAADWSGWKQERAVYVPGEVPAEYHRLLACSDPDEQPLDTGYLVAQYGKGAYIYTSYVWYRELKAENPGAFRCFANMISYRPNAGN